MGAFSCSYITVLKIVAICGMGIAFVLQAVGFSSKKWDGVDTRVYLHRWYAYQNLWTTFDEAHGVGSYAVYKIFDDSAWKMQVIYMETTGFGMTVVAFSLIMVSSFINKVAMNPKIQYAFSIMAAIGLFIGGSACIAGVKFYKDNYKKILSSTFTSLLEIYPDVYELTWAPYMCIASGSMYTVVGMVLVVDVVISAAKKKKSVLPTIKVDEENERSLKANNSFRRA